MESKSQWPAGVAETGSFWFGDQLGFRAESQRLPEEYTQWLAMVIVCLDMVTNTRTLACITPQEREREGDINLRPCVTGLQVLRRLRQRDHKFKPGLQTKAVWTVWGDLVLK